ncbi:MAG: hypothetical protein ACE5FW_00150 [Candidatus Aenigmatarchaeota archaeon]
MKYILVILVAALIIGVAYSIMSEFAGTVEEHGSTLTTVTGHALGQASEDTCTNFGCNWTEVNGTEFCNCST